jgi:hypothetical protein
MSFPVESPLAIPLSFLIRLRMTYANLLNQLIRKRGEVLVYALLDT